jgi:hypothetical protein
MLSFNFVIVCGFFERKRICMFFIACLFISVLLLEILFSREWGVGTSLNKFTFVSCLVHCMNCINTFVLVAMQLADIWLIHHGRLCTKVCIASILVAMQLADIWLIHHSLLCTKVCIIYHLPQKIVRGSFVFASWLKVDQNCNFLSRHLTHYLQNGRATMNINKKENVIIQKS